MSLTRCMASGSGCCRVFLHAAELAVQHLAAQQVLQLLEGLPGGRGAPVVVGQLPDRLGRVGRQRVQLGLAQPGLVGGRGTARPAPGRSRCPAAPAPAPGCRPGGPGCGSPAAAHGPAGAGRPGRGGRSGRGAAGPAARWTGRPRPAPPRPARPARRGRRTAPPAGRARRGTRRTGNRQACRLLLSSGTPTRRRSSSLDSRRIRYRPSRANSSAAAASPSDSPPSMPSRSMIRARPGTSPIGRSRSAAGTRSPDSTEPPSSNLASSPLRSALPSGPGTSRRWPGGAGAPAPRAPGPPR